MRHHKQNRYYLLQSSRRFSTTSRCDLSHPQQFRGSQQPFSSKPWKLGQTWRGKRQSNETKSTPHAAAVDPGGLFQCARHAVEEITHHPDNEREVERQVDHDEPGDTVDKPE